MNSHNNCADCEFYSHYECPADQYGSGFRDDWCEHPSVIQVDHVTATTIKQDANRVRAGMSTCELWTKRLSLWDVVTGWFR